MREQVADCDIAFAVLREFRDVLRRTLPCSTSCITAGVVATTFVRDAMSKIVSTVMSDRVGSSERLPKALR